MEETKSLNPFAICCVSEVEVVGGVEVDEERGIVKDEGRGVEDFPLPVTSLISVHVCLGSLIAAEKEFR